MTPLSAPSSTPSARERLCPNCGGVRLTILTTAVVSYDVKLEPETRELLVVGESRGESEWDHSSRAACPACAWQGTLQKVLD